MIPRRRPENESKGPPLVQASELEQRPPGAYAVGGNNNYDSGDDHDTSWEEAARDELVAHVEHSFTVQATLVSNEQVVVATEIVESEEQRSQTKLIHLLLCIPDPKKHTLNEKAVFDMVEEFPELFKKKYEMFSQDGTPDLSFPLCLICRLKPSLKLVQRILQVFPPAVCEVDSSGRLPLHKACGWGANFQVIKYLVATNPDGMRVADKGGEFPIHHACQHKAKSNVIQYLLSQAPDTAQCQRNDGALPLHVSIRGKCSDSAIRRLISVCPQAASITTNKGWLPLHTASRNCGSIDVVNDLLTVFPEAARHQTPEPNIYLPLHIACQHRADIAVIRALVAAFPDGVTKRDGMGCYPLHLAALYHDDAVIDEILESYPEAAKCGNLSGRLPIHGALTKPRSSETILALLSAYPESAKQEDSKMFLPLFRILSKAAACSIELIDKAISLNPDAVKNKNPDGVFALHVACMNGAKEETIRVLLDHFPDAASIPGGRGRLPLHSLCAGNDVPIGAVRHLLSANPDAAHIKDRNGALPIHSAVKAPVQVVDLLLQAYPDGVKEKLPAEKMLPLLVACKTHASVDVVRLLLAAYPDAASFSTDNDSLALHYACSSKMPEEVIQLLVDAHPQAVYHKNTRGETPIDLAVRSCCSPAILSLLKEMTIHRKISILKD